MQSEVGASVVESLDDAVVVIDGGRLVVGWNGAMERLTSCARTEAVARSVDDVLTKLPVAAWTRPIALALAGEHGAGPAVRIDTESTGGAWIEPRWAPRADGPGAVLVLRDVTEERKHALSLRALEAVGRSLTSSLDLEQVVETIAEKTREVMSADAALVASWDGRTEKATVLRASGRLSAEYAPGGIPLAGGPLSVALRERRAVTTSDVLADQRWHLDTSRRDHIAREGFKAVAVAPLVVKGIVHGALVVHQWAPRTFTAEEMTLLTMLAEQAALALENARLYADARRRAERLRELAQLEQMVAASLDPDAVLRAIASAAARLVGADIVQVWTADPSAKLLHLRASSASGSLPSVPETIPFGAGITGRTAADKRSIYIPDVTREPGALSAEWARQSGIQRLLTVPMLSGPDLLGVVTVRSRSDTLASEEDQALVTALAAQAAVAVQNAGAYADAVARGARLQALVSVTRSITASLDTADVIRRIVEAAAAMRPRALAAVHAIDADGSMHVTASPEMATLPLKRSIDAGLPGLVTQERRPVLVPEPLRDPRTLAPDWWRERPRASYYGVPIMIGDSLVGVLDYIVPEGVPDLEEQEALNLLAAHAGVAIRNASLYREAARRRDVAEALARLGHGLSSTLDIDRIGELVVSGTVELLGASGAAVYRYEPSDDTLRTVVSQGPDGTRGRSMVIRPGEGIAGRAVSERRIVVTHDVLNDPDVPLSLELRVEIERLGHQVAIGVPLLGTHGPVGSFVVQAKQGREFSTEEIQALQAFGDQAALALENARL